MNELVIGAKVQQMFGSIAAQYDRANTVLSFGIHYWWRKRLLKLLPAAGDLTVVDLCTGTGDLLPALAARYARVIGIDFCLPMLQAGSVRWNKLSNVSVLQGDALNLPLASHSIDLITVAFGVRNFERLRDGLREINRVLKPGATLVVLEFGQPTGFLWSRLFRFYSNVIMPAVGGLVTGNRDAYTYLPQTAQAFPCQDAFISVLEECGFGACSCEPLTSGVAYLYGARVK